MSLSKPARNHLRAQMEDARVRAQGEEARIEEMEANLKTIRALHQGYLDLYRGLREVLRANGEENL